MEKVLIINANTKIQDYKKTFPSLLPHSMIKKLHQVKLNIHWQSKGSTGSNIIHEDLHSIVLNAVIPTETL